ncbi:MAG: thioredoxin family protein [Thermoanaerobaculaceae bacterium]|nr:thioredoxin family protein [Thermoanaerobaculaceae bacterium]
MKSFMIFVSILILSFCSFSQIPPTDKSGDPFKDLQKAKSIATKEQKRILLIVGGDWCDWCGRLDDFINKDKELVDILNKNYVVVKVYCKGDLTPNGLFLAKFPTPSEFPHIFVLNSEGILLESKRTANLEKGESYDKSKVKEFLEYWAIKK